MKYLTLFLREQKGKTALTLLLLLLQSVGTLLIPYLIADIVDKGILAGDMGTVLRIGAVMLLVAVLSAAVAVWGSWCSADLAARFGRDMRSRLMEKSQAMTLREFNLIGVSSMVTRATSDISAMQSTFGLVLQLVIPAPLLAGVSIAMTLRTSPGLGVVLIISVAVFLVFAAVMLKASGRLSAQIQYKLDRINLVVREIVTGTRVIRAFGNEAHEEQRANGAFTDYAGNMVRLNKMFALVNPAVWLLIGISIAAIVWLGGLFAVNGQLAIGQITAVAEYSILTLSYLIMAAAVSTALPKMRACLNRLAGVLAIEPAIQDADVQSPQRMPDVPAVAFEDVTFSYPGAEQPVLEHITFQCIRGEITAIIGGTGSGKSTIADILLRFCDVDAGAVRLEGADVRAIPQTELRAAIGYVPQKAFLFSGTIGENLRMGNPDASDAALWEALRIAQADTFVAALPLGLEAPVAEGGANFSGGQRQRLSIARALIKQAAVYLFDDSFSALDAATDAALRRALGGYGADAAKIIIAQRVSTIRSADQILVLDGGRLAGAGRHEELMKTSDVYRDIVKSQFAQKEA